jgi:lambda repressor-like predicted transcriptional regulator
MSRKRLVVLSGGALVALLLVGVVGGSLVFAQDTEPAPGDGLRWARFGWENGSWELFDTAAEALGLTPNELFVKLHDEGKTLSEMAEEQGVDTDTLREAMSANRTEAMQERIQQAIEDGSISQEHGDWLLEGLDKGYTGGMHGLGMGHGGFGGPNGPPPGDSAE